MSWAEAAEAHVVSQQLQIDCMDEAEAVRSQSPNPESISETSLQPELFWVAPFEEVHRCACSWWTGAVSADSVRVQRDPCKCV